MAISKTSVGHRSKRITSHQAKKATTVQSLEHHNLSATEHRRRSWTPEQVFDGNYLKVPATTYIGLLKVHKWFWDKSIETKGRKDTCRYRVIDQATLIRILPENEWYDPIEDDETKIKILFVGLPFKEHSKYTTSPISKKRLRLHLSVVRLLRRICPDANMNTIQTADQWRQYLSPSIRKGFSQIRKSATFGWLPIANRKKSRKTQLPLPPASPRYKTSAISHVAI